MNTQHLNTIGLHTKLIVNLGSANLCADKFYSACSCTKKFSNICWWGKACHSLSCKWLFRSQMSIFSSSSPFIHLAKDSDYVDILKNQLFVEHTSMPKPKRWRFFMCSPCVNRSATAPIGPSALSCSPCNTYHARWNGPSPPPTVSMSGEIRSI